MKLINSLAARQLPRALASRAMIAATLALPCSTAFAFNFSCTATMSAMNFGNVDIANGSGLTSSATLTWQCRNTGTVLTRNARVCFSIGDGSPGQGYFTPRRMLDGSGNALQFQLYHPDGTTIWGAKNNGSVPVPYEIVLESVAPSQSRTGSIQMQGRIIANQPPPVAGSYQNAFSGAHTKISLAENAYAIPADCGIANDGAFPFTVTATVTKSCQVNATDLNFGTVPDPVQALNVDSQGTVNVTCTRATPYTVALSPSSGASNGAGEMSALGAIPGNTDKVPYRLYRDTGRANAWGNLAGINTASGTGTGLNHAYTVYGRVPSANFTADSYQDVVTVQVAY